MSTFDGLTNSAIGGSSGRVTQAIATASRRTGVDFRYLMGQAQIESSLNPTAKARTSSATGLYQFVEQSWLGILNDHGAAHGMSWAADAIQRGSNGRYYVSDPTLRQQILDLRKHPETASVMAAELASDNRAQIEQQTGRQAEPVDLYLAHFLGSAGAVKFLSTMQYAPNASAASLFPAAARANSSVFYDNQGNARSLAELRGLFSRRLADGAETAGTGGGFNAGSPYDDGMPANANYVQPADYVRIASAQMDAGDEAISGEDALASQQMLAQQPYPEFSPRAENARLAYLLLATFGR